MNRFMSSIISKILTIVAIYLIASCKSEFQSSNPKGKCEDLVVKGKYDESILCYKKMDTNNLDIIKNIGLIFLKKANYYRTHKNEDPREHKMYNSLRESIFWYEKAANKNDAQSEYLLGLIHGELMPKNKQDLKLSISFFEKSAYHGYGPAQMEMGIYYYDLGVRSKEGVFFLKSYNFFLKAKENKEEGADIWIELLEKERRI